MPTPLPPLRPFQKDALAKLAHPIHLICIAPTGSGKSRIYEDFVAANKPKTVLFSPLIALARQHTESLRARRIRVFGRFAGEDGVDMKRPTRPIFPKPRQSGVWLLSPESLLNDGTHAILKAWRPDFLVMDECHACWDWGESFRPALRKVLDLVSELKISRSLWLTATLPVPARKLLENRLPKPKVFQGHFELPSGLELKAARVPWSERADALQRWLELRSEPGIVFVTTRTAAEQVRALVSRAGRETTAYHAGLSAEERATIESKLRTGEPLVVVATSAFGMGMHFPQLQWALLWQAPASLLSLAQAIGRVGRGTKPSHAMLFWDDDDFRLVEWMTGNSDERGRALSEVRDFLKNPGSLSARLN